MHPPPSVGPYRLLERLGQGGMGAVYRAEHHTMGALRAVKLLVRLADVSSRARFAREARSLAAIRHPNVVTVHDSGLHGDTPWFAMDLLEGETLTTLLARERLPFARALELAIGLADGLAALHAAGVVHRDLKPENVVITAEGRPVLIDLGLALVPGSDERLTRTGAALGTIGWMAPEQLLGQRADRPTVDVHALGLILYELVTGRSSLPEGTSTLEAMRRGALDGRRLIAGETDPELPAALDAVLSRALARDPARRFAHAGELREALSRLRDAPGPSHRVVARRRRALAFAATSLILVGVGLWLWPDAAPPAAPPTVPLAADERPTREEPPDPRALAKAADELRELRRLASATERLAGLAAWLRAHPRHPDWPEAEHAWRAVRREVPLLRLRAGPAFVAFLPDPLRALVITPERQASTWTVADPPAQVASRDLPFPVSACAVSPDGRRALIGGVGGELAFLPTDLGAAPSPFGRAGDPPGAVAWSPDGTRVAVGTGTRESQGGLLIVDAGAASIVARRPVREQVDDLAWTPDGRELVSVSGLDFTDAPEPVNELVVWSREGERLRGARLGSHGISLVVTPDGANAVIGFDASSLELYSLARLEHLRSLRAEGVRLLGEFDARVLAHRGSVRALALAGGRLFSLGGDRRAGGPNELRVWDTTTWADLERTLPLGGYPSHLAVTADGRWALISGSDLDTPGGTVLHDLEPVWVSPR